MPPRAADADEQRVTEGLLDDAADAADVLDGKGEEHELHRPLGDGVVVLKVRVHRADELVHVGDEDVLLALRVHEVAVQHLRLAALDERAPLLLALVPD